MARTANVAGSPPLSPSPPDLVENNQPFFILHKGSSRKSDKKSAAITKTRRRIDLSPSLPKNAKKVDALEPEECDDYGYEHLRMCAFELVWSRIESAIKDVLRDIDQNVFNEIHCWVHQSFNAIRSLGAPCSVDSTRSFPIVTNAASKQLFTGLVLTKNMEFVDDLMTFEELSLHLKSHGCHVAKLSSLDFSVKNGIGGCVRSLLRQFLTTTLDTPDLSILASWYKEQGNYNSPVVVIIDDMERCCGSVLSDFVLMLSEWVMKIPIILIIGVATTLDTPKNILPSNALQCLSPRKFNLGSPAEKMDAIVEAVLVNQCSGFSVGHKVAVFLRNYFLNQDGTLTSFIRALKIACVQHFFVEPLSFRLRELFVEHDNQGKKHGLLQEVMIKNAYDIPSYARNEVAELTGEDLVHGILELKRLQKHWSTVILCLYEAGKSNKIRLLDLLCEALNPDLYNSKDFAFRKGGFICQAVRKVRDLPAAKLFQLLKSWEKLTMEVVEIHDKVKELLSALKFEDGMTFKQDLIDISKRHASRIIEKESKAMNEKAAKFTECMVRGYMQPIECIPFHEIVCFRNVEKLQSALIGDPRRSIQVDLLEFYKILQCRCCSKTGNMPQPSMHDTSIMYTLAQEHGDFINLHDWFESFKRIVIPPSTKGKRKLKQSPLPKKRKDMHDSENTSEASIQARFCRAVTELQITGLVRMPSKRRPEFVQRVAFGL